MQICAVFPHQLFIDHPLLKPDVPIWLIEDPLFFGDWQYPLKFHKQKLTLHRASMKSWAQLKQQQGYQVQYIEYHTIQTASTWKNMWSQVTKVEVLDPCDFILEKRLQQLLPSPTVVTVHETPGFLSTRSDLHAYHDQHSGWRMATFYAWQRQRLGILVNKQGQPEGGQWSFDEENRHTLPKDLTVPAIPALPTNENVTAAIEYVEKHFPDNYGSTAGFTYPVDHHQAETWLHDFLQKRLANFGPYEDAIHLDQPTLFHSVLSSSLNIGLLTPQQVVTATLTWAKNHEVPFNSLEGFIRQIIGWREFVRAVYHFEGSTQRTKNFWHFKRQLPESFWTGKTGLLPFDQLCEQLHQTAYAHHIPRLMVAGNLMLLAEIDPDEVYRWFMTFFIDAYDWVMVPNIYGMSQFSDGGKMVTKPYFSSSKYLLKMSNYEKGEWCEIWDSLFWRFIADHQEYLAKQPRLGMMVKLWRGFSQQKQQLYLSQANTFLQEL